MKSKISIDKLLLSPYDHSSKLAHVYPGFELFTGRRDFIRFGKQKRLAVACSLSRDDDERTESATLRFTIRRVSDGYIAGSRDVSVIFNCGESLVPLRADIFLPAAAVDGLADYEVTAARAGNDDEVLCSAPIRFFANGLMPGRFYTLRRAYVAVDGIDSRLCTYDAAIHDDVKVEMVFDIEENPDVPQGIYPELYTRLHLPDGRMIESRADVREIFCSAKQVRIEVPADASGAVYAELCCFGYPVMCALSHGLGPDMEGEIDEELCRRILDYDADMGLRKVVGFYDVREADARRRNSGADARARLDRMVGLDDVKAHIDGYMKLTRFNQLRAKAGLKTCTAPLHSLFIGPVGTGKTTVASIMGELLHEAGVLSKGHVVVRERSTLLGQFYNSEAEKTLQALEEAQGGILFIDEAYQLYQPEDPRDPGRFVLEALMTALADESKRDWMLILAGYPEPTKRLLEVNPGLRSRIPETNFYNFESYSAEELVEMAGRYFKYNDFELTPEAHAALDRLLRTELAAAGDDFGNGRHVSNLISTRILPSMAGRISAMSAPTGADLRLVTEADIPQPIVKNCPRSRRIGYVA